MTGADLPDADHVARYCSPRMVADGLPLLEAFVPEPLDLPLSVVWVEHFGDVASAATFDELRREVGANLRLRPNGRFAVINVGSAKLAAAPDDGRALRIRHAPLDRFPSHAEISGLERESPRVSRRLQRLVSESDMRPAVVDRPEELEAGG